MDTLLAAEAVDIVVDVDRGVHKPSAEHQRCHHDDLLWMKTRLVQDRPPHNHLTFAES